MSISSILCCFFPKRKNEQKIKNYIFQGGGTKGIAYIGALQELENNGIKLENIQRICGTSVGAITAAFLCVGFDLETLNREFNEINFESLIDIENESIKLKLYKYNKSFMMSEIQSKLEKTIEYIKDRLKDVETFYWPHKVKRLFNIAEYVTSDETCKDLYDVLKYAYDNKGLAKGEKIRDWIEKKMSGATNITNLTFAELYEKHKSDPKKYKQLFIIGTNLAEKKTEIFSHENTPNLIISDAVRISLSLPVVFQPHCFYEKKGGIRVKIEKNDDLYVDGGIMDNYPVWVFDSKNYSKDHINAETLGSAFRLVPLKTIIYNVAKSNQMLKMYEKRVNALTNFGFVTSLLGCFYEKQESDFHLQSENHLNRTVLIDHNNVSTFNFNLSNKDKRDLIALGQTATRNYLNDPDNIISTKEISNGSSFLKRGAFIGGVFIGGVMLGFGLVKALYSN
jgi:NTE family protein